MTKKEFSDGLRTALTGELPDAEVDNNVKYYDDYIRTKSSENSELEVMDQLGDPRLIAKTIVETYQISHGPFYQSAKHDKAYEDIHVTDDHIYEDQQQSNNNTSSNGYRRSYAFSNPITMTWYQKLLLFIVSIVFISLIVVIGGIMIKLFFSIGVPLIMIYFVYRIIKNSTRR